MSGRCLTFVMLCMCSAVKVFVVGDDSSVNVQNLSSFGDRAKDRAVVALVSDAICMRHRSCCQFI